MYLLRCLGVHFPKELKLKLCLCAFPVPFFSTVCADFEFILDYIFEPEQAVMT